MDTQTKGVVARAPASAPPGMTMESYGLAIAKALETYGVDTRRVLAAAGVSEDLANDPLRRLPVDVVTRLYRRCVDATNDPYFGLTVARFLNASNLHALGYGLLASATLMEFLERVQRYFPLLSQTARVEIVPNGREVRLNFVLQADVSAESQDAWLGAMHRTMCLVYREDFRPVAVELAHPVPPGGDGPYVAFFRAPVRFDCSVVALILARTDLDVRLHGACPELAQANDNLAAHYIARLDRKDVVANVRARILELLPSGACSRRRVATQLGMSPTTLRERLSDRGTTFHDLLNDVRRELACSFLRQSGVSVTEVAFMLGFADVSNFTRAFKRWTGTSPTRFRDRHAS